MKYKKKFTKTLKFIEIHYFHQIFKPSNGGIIVGRLILSNSIMANM